MSLFYKRCADFIEVTIRDASGRKMEVFRCNILDRRACTELLNKLKDKYGFEPLTESINNGSWIKT